jgi:hypothetical protein
MSDDRRSAFRKGDTVRIKSTGETATVLDELKRGTLIVSVNGVVRAVSEGDIEKLEAE